MSLVKLFLSMHSHTKQHGSKQLRLNIPNFKIFSFGILELTKPGQSQDVLHKIQYFRPKREIHKSACISKNAISRSCLSEKTSRRASRYVRPAFRSSELRSDLEVSIRKSAFPIQTDKMLFWRTSSSHPSSASSGNGVNSDLKRRKDFPRCPRDRTKIVRVIQGQLLSQQLSASCQIHKK